MADNKIGQVAPTPAEIYDERFVPALFQQWVSVVADAAGIGPRQCVLDVACGTGALAIGAAERVGGEGKVVGLDPNEEMLAVARRKSANVEWMEGRAESIPFPDESFDAVISQFGFMFFEDHRSALREMTRTLRPGGKLAIAVCDALDHSPGYAAVVDLLRRLFGDPVADAFRRPFALGDPDLLLSMCADAGISGAKILWREGKVRFSSIEELISTERACIWTLGGMLDDAQFEILLKEAEHALSQFVTTDGLVAFDMPALIITASRA